jgi:small subunit ribosomal protein S5
MKTKRKERKEHRSQQNTDVETKVVRIDRTSKAVTGGTNFSFRALVVCGNGKGKVGYGIAKAKETSSAIRKAEDAAKAMMNDPKNKIPMNGSTVYYATEYNFGATKVKIIPGHEGSGVIAGQAMRSVFDVAGIRNVVGKIYKSTNPINVVQATIKALFNMSSPEEVAQRRGLRVEQLFNVEEG